jgi:glyoxylase-like metal-dependent hydrolase (beta-lactamase superfamily II)
MVKRVVTLKGGYDSNAYFCVDDETKHGFLFDCGAEGKRLSDIMDKEGYVIEKIIITHGHFDHRGGIAQLRENKKIPVYIHEAGKLFLSDPKYNLSIYTGSEPISISANGYFKDGDLIETEGKELCFRVINTPGHTDDSCVFYNEKDGYAITGDTIFKGTYGNTRFPTGDYHTLMRSIKEKILTLPDNTVLYSGHTLASTVGEERKMYNV